jgi:signal transduction histidine kinase
MDTGIASPAPTQFAPAERATDSELRASVQAVCSHPLLKAVLDAFSGLVLVLNRQRQIVAVNDSVLGRLGFDSEERALGLRPGELLDCIHAGDHEGGCGTSARCAYCGSTTAIVASQQKGVRVSSECQLSIKRGDVFDAVDFEVLATPFEVGGERLTLLSLRDISDTKRAELLERTFFHDVLNTVSSIRGWNELLVEGGTGELGNTARRVQRLVSRLVEQVEYQRAVRRATTGELALELAPLSVFELFEDLESLAREHPAAQDRRLELPAVSADVELTSDRSLLLRVLTNMLINAFEATATGGSVRLDWQCDGDRVEFSVWNDAAIPAEVALQIFTRSFSTKAARGRGLGTFAMKLFGERFLGGAVGFVTAEGAGTTFSITLPIGGPSRK